MTSLLPYADISFCDEGETARIATEFMENKGEGIPNDGEWGYSLEVTVDFPDVVADRLSEYPPLCDKREVTPDELSPFTKELMEKQKLKPAKTKKLISDLLPKKNLKIHFTLLKSALALGVRLLTVHRVVKYKQSAWLSPYIRFNNECRKKSTSASESAYFKLRNNSCFGV